MPFTPELSAYRWYEDDGDEASSTPAAAQNTNPGSDLSGGNVLRHLRLRVDETGGVSGATTDDWQLQYSKNGGAWASVTASSENVRSPSAPLKDGLAAYWNLDEASGQRNDSHTNVLHLTDNDGVGSATGVGAGQTAADFSHAHFSHVDDANLQIGDRDLTAVLWVRPEAPGEEFFLKKGSGTTLPDPDEYLLGFTVSERFIWHCKDSTGSISKVQDPTIRSLDEWCFIEFGHDAGNDQIFISVDRASPVVAGATGGIVTTTGQFGLGWFIGSFSRFTGRQQTLGIWHRLLTTDDKDKLYNGGTAALLYDDLGVSSQLADGAATTNRATDGITDPPSGTFVAGVQESDDGHISDHQLTANDFTEHVWALELVADDLIDDDILTFRVVLNGTPITSGVTPRITRGAGGIDLLRLVAEALGTAETEARPRALARLRAEPQAVTETPQRAIVLLRRAAEALGIGHAAVRVRDLVRRRAGAMGIAEDRQTVRGLQRIANEIVALAEAADRQLGLSQVIGEAVAAGEAVVRLLRLNRLVPETAGIGDAALRLRGLLRAPAEPEGIGEARRRALALSRARADDVAVADARERVRGLSRQTGEPEAIAEASGASRVLTRLRVEAVALGETTVAIVSAAGAALVRVLSEAAGFTETVARAAGLTRLAAEPVATAETTARGRTMVRAVTGAIAIATASVVSRALVRLRAGVMGIVEALAKALGIDFTPSADRQFVVAAEPRDFVVPAELRDFVVAAEQRRFTVPGV